MKITFGQLLTLIILLIIIGVGGFFGVKQLKGNSHTRQAVFLTNGQVYFGKVTSQSASTVVMKDIYYLQVQQNLQQGQQSNEQPQINLVKLGNELHGPEDEMRINRDHVLFIEDMKDNSKVNDAIANYVKSGGQNQPSTPQQ